MGRQRSRRGISVPRELLAPVHKIFTEHFYLIKNLFFPEPWNDFPCMERVCSTLSSEQRNPLRKAGRSWCYTWPQTEKREQNQSHQLRGTLKADARNTNLNSRIQGHQAGITYGSQFWLHWVWGAAAACFPQWEPLTCLALYQQFWMSPPGREHTQPHRSAGWEPVSSSECT